MSVTLKILNSQKAIATYHVVGKSSKPVIIDALESVNYQLIDDSTQFGPQNIITKRAGDDLQIFLNDGDQATDIIKDYYADGQPISRITGLHQNGNIYSYIPESGQATDAISMLAKEVLASQALGGTEIAAFWALSPSLAAVGSTGLLTGVAAVAGIAAIAGASSSGSKEASNNKSDPAVNNSVDSIAPREPTIGSANKNGVSGKVAEDEGTQTVNVTLTPDDPSQLPANAKNNGDGTYTIPVEVKDDGTWQTPVKPKNGSSVTAQAVDAAGNTSDPAVNSPVDSIAPSEPTIESANENGVSGKVTDDEGTQTVNVTLTPDDPSQLPANAKNNGDGTYTIPVEVKEDGTWQTPVKPKNGSSVTAESVDAAGNTSDPAVNNPVDSIAPSSPEVTEVDGKDPAKPTNDTTPAITVKVEGGSTPKLVDDNGKEIPADAVDNGDGTWTLTPKDPIEHPDNVNVVTTDAAGNASEPAQVPLTIDTTISLISVSIVADNNLDNGEITGEELTGQPTTLAVTITLDDLKAVSAGDTLTVEDNAGNTQTIILTETDITSGYVTVDLPRPDEDSLFKVTATLTDAAGNSASGADSATLNLLPPGTPIPNIDLDSNNDGYINSVEKGAQTHTDVTVKLAFPTAGEDFSKPQIGDTLKLTNSDNEVVATHKLTAEDIAAKKVIFEKLCH